MYVLCRLARRIGQCDHVLNVQGRGPECTSQLGEINFEAE